MSKQKDEAIYRKGWNDGFAKGAAAARFQLEAENAKLRELLDYITPIAWHAASENERDRMYELGAEP